MILGKRMLKIGLAGSVAVLLAADAGHFIRSSWAGDGTVGRPCVDDGAPGCTELWGFFTEPGVRTRVLAGTHSEYFEGDWPFLQFGDGPMHEFPVDGIGPKKCKDQQTGLDQIFVEVKVHGTCCAPQGHMYVVQSGTGVFEQAYATVFLSDDGWSEETFVDAEGNCLWRTFEEAQQALGSTLAALMERESQQVDFDVAEGGTVDLSPRRMANEPVREAFRTIRKSGFINGNWSWFKENFGYEGKGMPAVPRPLAVSVGTTDGDSWLVVSIDRPYACDDIAAGIAPAGRGPADTVAGIVLIQNKRQGTWRSLHDIRLGPDDCERFFGWDRQLHIDLMSEIYVKDDKLFAEVCLSQCMRVYGRDESPSWAWFEFDLLRNLATRLPGRPDFMPIMEELDDEAMGEPDDEAALSDVAEFAGNSLPHSPGERFRDCPECPEMVVVPAGSFLMGSPDAEEGRDADEGPMRQIELSEPFAVGVYEVTFNELEAACGEGRLIEGKLSVYCGNSLANAYDAGWGAGSRPAINVDWDAVQFYLNWLRDRTGREYRLLTEAEWEYAARGGTQSVFF